MIMRTMRPLLLLGLLLIEATTLLAQSTPAKRPLRHSDYDSWRSIQGTQLSNDGRYLAYTLVPQEGDSEIVVRDLQSGQERRFGIGSRAAAGPDGDAQGAPARLGRGAGSGGESPSGSRASFTRDGRFFLFLTAPTKADQDKARRNRQQRPETPLRGGLTIVKLADWSNTKIEQVRSFQVPEEGTPLVVYQKDSGEATPPPQRPTGAQSGGTGSGPGGEGGRFRGGAAAPRRQYGSELVLRSLTDNTERSLAEVLDYSIAKDGELLVYTVGSRQEARNGVYALTPGTTGMPTMLLVGRGRYSRLTWDEKQTQLAFVSDRDDAAAPRPTWKLYHWKRTGAAPTPPLLPLTVGLPGTAQPLSLAALLQKGLEVRLATELVSTATPGVRPGFTVSERGTLAFSADGQRLFFGVGQPQPAREDNREGAADSDERVSVELWHWNDEFIQPMQKLRAEQDRNRTYRAVYHLPEKHYQQLADETMADIQSAPREGVMVIGSDDRPYRRLVGYDANYHDHFLVNTMNGLRRPILQKHQWGATVSPKGKYVLFYDGKDWNTIAVADGRRTNLTVKLGVSFVREDHDTPNEAPNHGLAGWTADDQSVLVYDRYDVWQLAPDGSSARNLTGGIGRQEKLQFRVVRLDTTEDRAFDPTKPLLLKADHEVTREEGFYRVTLQSSSWPEKLLYLPKNLGMPLKAKKGDTWVVSISSFDEFPDLHVTDADFKNLRKVSDANPQKAQLLWGTSELVNYKNLDGQALTGIVCKPENFDPKKKYPLLVYIYERLSQNVHNFVSPGPGTSINVSYYVSNGYVVLMPDIVYTIGYPGQSALKCVLPAVQALVDQGFIDENAIGIQGHSWGGYQIAYMVTQTGRFKAASAGAPVANMVSAYDGIRWGTGLPRQFQYERTQSRIGGNLWQYPTRFIENSPIFMADRVKTPLLMLHNDRDDAVPWYQGIEYFLALRRLGKEVYLFNYPGELHGLRRRANQKDYTVRLQQFFDHHLKGAAKPEWMEKGQPATPTQAPQRTPVTMAGE